MQNRYIIEDDTVTIIERCFPSSRGKKKDRKFWTLLTRGKEKKKNSSRMVKLYLRFIKSLFRKIKIIEKLKEIDRFDLMLT